jgi:benzoyl-CoA-dihydrodiol lyase
MSVPAESIDRPDIVQRGPGPVVDAEVHVPSHQVDFDTGPDCYLHWRLSVEGDVATLSLDVTEEGGLVPGYELKMNSYDLGVDIEMHDALQRLRFEHPTVKAVIVTSAKERMFCAGANIRMLAQSSHEWKVNFCKFTNETRNSMEDSSASGGIKFIAALNGTAAGGGYEIALACDEIVLVDDGSSAVSLPEVPLLGVLPGTGGLTRVVDKRHVRKDRADVFATKRDGLKGKVAVEWGLVDEVVPRSNFDERVRERARAIASSSRRPDVAEGVGLTPLSRELRDDSLVYEHVVATLDRDAHRVAITIAGPVDEPPATAADACTQGADYYMLALARELDDLVLRLRTNEPDLGLWTFHTQGELAQVLTHDAFVQRNREEHWFLDEVHHYFKRVLKRLDVTSRSLVAVIEPGSCFGGALLELALACDRQYMLDGTRDGDNQVGPAAIAVTATNFGALPMGNGLARLESRFYGQADKLDLVRGRLGERLDAGAALAVGLVTLAPDEIDWDDELRIALEERASFSPDALSAMEANHRFVGPETIETKIFGRLSAWQNWVFTRPNASGPDGALRRFGTGHQPDFNTRRV